MALANYPLQCESVKALEKDENLCYVHFQSWIQPRDFDFKKMELHEVCFDIVGTAPAKFIETLKEGEYYTIKGKLIDFIPNALFKTYTSHMAYTPMIGISKEIGMEGYYNIEMGMMLFEIEAIQPFVN